MVAGLAICLWWAMPTSAEDHLPIQHFSCVFEERVSPTTGGVSHTETLRIEFFVDRTGHAFAVGRNVYPVRVVVGDQGVTYLEELASGAVQSTTIHKNGTAVHSRHTILLGEFIPSQYYGTCKYQSG